jgi:enoyl-[acyl-carrier protein] reductase I
MGDFQTALLRSKRGLIVGIANESSIAAGCARNFAASGASLAPAAAAPERHLVDIDDNDALAAFLVGDDARRVIGTPIPVDGGQHLI